MTHPKTTGKNKTTNLNIETVEEPANSTVNKEGQIPPKGPKVEKRLKEAVNALDAPTKK
ncbi:MULTISPECIES: hypothetical protein [Pseudochrobactrum]|uniref:hypothetical protein n=1 Tax=Pseudochrobactrum TaxID=354349 RepID=UPI000A6BBC7D|nr:MULTISPECIES: hypothetical protein [Pseudochrobactrum]MBX8812735.1 hypothetical protein [Ochrobactrum sp. MR34]MDP8250697.1 hypothetical protein [Pseudochrobactrum saccharolyticum]UCA47623.1 hypothetical protein LDL70_16345 [Pseudochrobactrum sp. XF203]